MLHIAAYCYMLPHLAAHALFCCILQQYCSNIILLHIAVICNIMQQYAAK